MGFIWQQSDWVGGWCLIHCWWEHEKHKTVEDVMFSLSKKISLLDVGHWTTFFQASVFAAEFVPTLCWRIGPCPWNKVTFAIKKNYTWSSLWNWKVSGGACYKLSSTLPCISDHGHKMVFFLACMTEERSLAFGIKKGTLIFFHAFKCFFVLLFSKPYNYINLD